MRIAGTNNWIEELSPEVQNELKARMKRLEVPAGRTVREAGDMGTSICQIEKGYVKLVADLPTGDQTLLAVYVPGNLFGETAVISERRLFHTTIAATDVVVQYLTKPDFAECYAAYPEIPEALCRKFAYMLSSSLTFREVKAQHPIGQQVAIVMLNLAECSSTARIGKSKEIDIPITIAEISAFLGVTRQTVQKEITRLKNAKVLAKTAGHWSVIDVEKLEREISNFSERVD